MKAKGKFLTELNATPLPDGRNWRVNAPLRYQDADGRIVDVPAGFITDFASIPPLSTIAGAVAAVAHVCVAAGIWPVFFEGLFWFAIFVCLVAYGLMCDTRLNGPATIHDFGFRVLRWQNLGWLGRSLGWLYWNCVLRRAARANGVKLWKRIFVLGGVDFFGWAAWLQDARLNRKGKL